MRTEEELLAAIEEAEREAKMATELKNKLKEKIATIKQINLPIRFPHLEDIGEGLMKGSLVKEHFVPSVPDSKIEYLLRAYKDDKGGERILAHVGMSRGDSSITIGITEKDLAFFDQLVADLHRALTNKTVEVTKPLFVREDDNNDETF